MTVEPKSMSNPDSLGVKGNVRSISAPISSFLFLFSFSSLYFLGRITLLDEDDDNITLYEDDDYDEDVDTDEVDQYETYYAKTSSDEVRPLAF